VFPQAKKGDVWIDMADCTMKRLADGLPCGAFGWTETFVGNNDISPTRKWHHRLVNWIMLTPVWGLHFWIWAMRKSDFGMNYKTDTLLAGMKIMLCTIYFEQSPNEYLLSWVSNAAMILVKKHEDKISLKNITFHGLVNILWRLPSHTSRLDLLLARSMAWVYSSISSWSVCGQCIEVSCLTLEGGFGEFSS